MISDGQTEPLGDGAVYVADAQKWHSLPPSPFDRPLYQAGGVWTGSEVVVLGTPCGPTNPDMELARCEPGGVQAAAYSPADNHWRSIEGVEAPEGAGIEDGYPLESTGVGWDGNDAVFSVSSQQPDQRLLLVDPEAESSRWAPAIEQTDADCVAGGAVLAVRTGAVSPEGASSAPNPEAAAEPLRVYRLDDAGPAWTLVSETPKPASTGAMFQRVVCSAGQLAYLPIMPPPTGFDGGALWWSPDRAAWEPVPAFGGLGYRGEARIADASGMKVVWVDGDGELLLLPEGASVWATVPKPEGVTGRVSLGALASGVLVDETVDVRPPTPLAVGILDPARYAAARGADVAP